MGMWGTGIFANDRALDFLDGLVDDFVRRINAGLGLDQGDGELAEVKPTEQVTLADLDGVVLPSVAILVRICGGDASSGGARTFNSGLLERIASEAEDAEPDSRPNSWRRDPISEWSAVPPPVSVIRTWRDRVLAAFDLGVKDAEVSADYVDGRPAVIQTAFDRLEELAADYD